MTEDQSRIRLNTSDNDVSYSSLLQHAVAMAESELKRATDDISLTFLATNQSVRNRYDDNDNIDYENIESSTSNPAESYKTFKDIKYQALFDGTTLNDDETYNAYHPAYVHSHNGQRKSCDMNQSRSTVHSIENQTRGNDADEDFLPNRQNISKEISMIPPRCKLSATRVSNLTKMTKSMTPSTDRSFEINSTKIIVGSTPKSFSGSVASSQTLPKAAKQGESISQSSYYRRRNTVMNANEQLLVYKPPRLSRSDIKGTQCERSDDVKRSKSLPMNSNKSTKLANKDMTPSSKCISSLSKPSDGNKVTQVVSLTSIGRRARRKSLGFSTLISHEKSNTVKSTADNSSKDIVTTVNSHSILQGTPESRRKPRKKTRVRVPKLSPKLRKSIAQLPLAPTPTQNKETRKTLVQAISRRKISPVKGSTCKPMVPKKCIPKIRRDISTNKALTFTEETIFFLRKGFRENITPPTDGKGLKPTVPKSPSFQRPFVATKYLTKTKTLAEQMQQFLSSGLRNNTPIKKSTYTLTTPVSPKFSTRGAGSSITTVTARIKSLTLAEETNLFLRTGFRRNIPSTKDLKEFKPTIPKSPSFQKPCRLFCNSDLPKTKTLAEQTQAFLSSGLRNNTPIKKSTYTLTTPVSPNFSKRGRDSLNVSADCKRKSITLAEQLSIQRSCLREINNDHHDQTFQQKYSIPMTPNLHKPYKQIPDIPKVETLTEKRDSLIRNGLRQGSINIPPCIRVINKPLSSVKTDDSDIQQSVALGMIDPWQD